MKQFKNYSLIVVLVLVSMLSMVYLASPSDEIERHAFVPLDKIEFEESEYSDVEQTSILVKGIKKIVTFFIAQ